MHFGVRLYAQYTQLDKLQRWLKFMADILKVPRIYDYMPFRVRKNCSALLLYIN